MPVAQCLGGMPVCDVCGLSASFPIYQKLLWHIAGEGPDHCQGSGQEVKRWKQGEKCFRMEANFGPSSRASYPTSRVSFDLPRKIFLIFQGRSKETLLAG